MRRNARFSTKQRSSSHTLVVNGGTAASAAAATVFFGSLAPGYQAQGLFSSLNKVYIRNFHEYHHRARLSDSVSVSGNQY